MQVFISYADRDELLARKVTDGLKKAGLKVWYEGYEILPGENWADKIAKALRESDAMVVLLTQDALHSNRVRRDIEYALGVKKYKERLIPVMVGTSDNDFGQSYFPWVLWSSRRVSIPKNGKQERAIKQIAEALSRAAA
jgi:hypothetical protein